MFGVHPAGGFEVGQAKFLAAVFDALAQHAQCAVFCHIFGNALEQLLRCFGAVLLFQILELFGLGGLNESNNSIRNQAKFFVVIFGGALMIA